jgi:hypothetical protein
VSHIDYQDHLPVQERNATVAVYGDLEHAEEAVRTLERAGFDMAALSIIATGMTEERHVIGFDTPAVREGRWARWGALWGGLFAAFILLPGVGGVAIGGYLLYILVTAALGAGAGALAAALSTVGVPADAVIRYETALRADKQILIAHGTTSTIEHARMLLADTSAESIEAHHGAAVPASARPARSSRTTSPIGAV